MNIKQLFVFILIMSLITLSACGGARKCNGSRGTSTDMGTM